MLSPDRDATCTGALNLDFRRRVFVADKETQEPILTMESFFYRYPGAKAAALDSVSLALFRGQCLCVTGPSGSGKSTLLRAIQGLLPEPADPSEGGSTGTLEVELDTAMVFQNADTQILCTTVTDEVLFGPDNRGIPPEDRNAIVAEVLEATGLTGFESRNVEELSAGEKHRLTIASVLSMKPGLLLFDEPSAQLDDAGKERMRSLLARIKENGHTVIIADHDLHPYRDLADRYLVMTSGRLEESDFESWSTAFQRNPAPSRSGRTEKSEAVLSLDNIHMAGHGSSTLFDNLSFSLYPGESVFLYGLNGAGKSTLLACAVGLLKPNCGTVAIAGMSPPDPSKLLGKAALLSQNPLRQLFEITVFKEVAFSLKRMGLEADEIEDRVMFSLALLGIDHLAGRSPMTISFGEQHRVALASLIATRPAVLLLDEPFSGLDFPHRFKIIDALSALRDDHGMAVLIASHGSLPDPSWPDRTYILEGGRLHEGTV